MKPLVLALAAAALVGCVSQHPRRLLDFSTPMYAWHNETASCGKLVVVDGARRLWTEKGCDGATTGYVRMPEISPAAFASIVKAFNGLPHQVPDCPTGASVMNIFTARDSDIQKTWRLCPSDAKDPLPPEFAAIEEAFKAAQR